MKPPICEVCGDDFRREFETSRACGDLVAFADYEPLPEGVTGHPAGLCWICERHVEAARGLTHLRSGEAIDRLRARPA